MVHLKQMKMITKRKVLLLLCYLLYVLDRTPIMTRKVRKSQCDSVCLVKMCSLLLRCSVLLLLKNVIIWNERAIERYKFSCIERRRHFLIENANVFLVNFVAIQDFIAIGTIHSFTLEKLIPKHFPHSKCEPFAGNNGLVYLVGWAFVCVSFYCFVFTLC